MSGVVQDTGHEEWICIESCHPRERRRVVSEPTSAVPCEKSIVPGEALVLAAEVAVTLDLLQASLFLSARQENFVPPEALRRREEKFPKP